MSAICDQPPGHLHPEVLRAMQGQKLCEPKARPQQATAIATQQAMPSSVSSSGSPFDRGNRIYPLKIDQSIAPRFSQPEAMSSAFGFIEMYMGGFMLLRLEDDLSDDLFEAAELAIMAARGLFLNGLLDERVSNGVAAWFDGNARDKVMFQQVLSEVAHAKFASGSVNNGGLAHSWDGTDPDGDLMIATLRNWSDVTPADRRHALSHLLNRVRCCSEADGQLRIALDRLEARLGLELPVLPISYTIGQQEESGDRRREAIRGALMVTGSILIILLIGFLKFSWFASKIFMWMLWWSTKVTFKLTLFFTAFCIGFRSSMRK